MHTFVVLSLIAVVSAERLGYDYQVGLLGPGYQDIGSESNGISNYGLGPEGVAGLGLNSNLGGSGRVIYEGSADSPTLSEPVVSGGLNKEFYHFSAPEAEFYDGDASQRAISSLKQNLRVVFIKAPENNGLTDAALQVAKQATNDKTAIYVLSKQPDISELANQVQQIRDSVRQRPDVRFIKYRTTEEAINAQQAIQQQYDALGGSTHSSNEGIAPVLSFDTAPRFPLTSRAIGTAGELDGSSSASKISPSRLIGGGVSRQYLPVIDY